MTLTINHLLPENGALPRDVHHASLSGLVGVACQLARGSAQAGAHVHLIGLTADAAAPPHYVTQGLAMHRVRSVPALKLGSYDLRYLAPSLAISARLPADIVHAHVNPYLLYSPRARRRILHLHMDFGALPRFAQRALQRADLVIAVSQWLRNKFLQMADYPAERVVVVPNGIDLAAGSDSINRSDLRTRYGIDPAAWLIGFAGQISWEKGVDYLIEAMARLHAARTSAGQDGTRPIHLIVAGSSTVWRNAHSPSNAQPTQFEQALAARASGLPVTFLGKIAHSEVRALMRQIDLLAFPSVVDEGFPLTPIEALAAGVPVVGSRVGGVPEIINDGVNGVLVPPRDSLALATALNQLMADPSRYRHMAAQARYSSRRFELSAQRRQIQQLYADLVVHPRYGSSRTFNVWHS